MQAVCQICGFRLVSKRIENLCGCASCSELLHLWGDSACRGVKDEIGPNKWAKDSVSVIPDFTDFPEITSYNSRGARALYKRIMGHDVPEATWRYWRSSGQGPAFYKITSKIYRYRESDLLAWIESRRVESQATPVTPTAEGK